MMRNDAIASQSYPGLAKISKPRLSFNDLSTGKLLKVLVDIIVLFHLIPTQGTYSNYITL